MVTLLVGTQNPGKQREYQDLLADLPVRWFSPADVGLGEFDADEGGATFEENARRKALAYARAAALPVLADDSGLEVDALDGEPGVHSARYAGPQASDEDRTRQLLRALQAVPDPERTARFVCVVALALPDGRVFTARGTLEGRIGHELKGTEGFGYDPVFVLPDGRHLAELPAAEKHAISHRGLALAALKPILVEMLESLEQGE